MQTAPFASQQDFCSAPAPVLSASPARRLRVGLALLALLCLFSATAHAQLSIFLRIGGQAATMGATQTAPALPGSSTDAQYPKWINVNSLTHGITLPMTTGTGGQTAAGKPKHADLQVTKLMDATSPALALLANGSDTGLPTKLPIDYVTLDFRTTGGTSTQVFYRIELQQVYVTSYSVQTSGDVPSEGISFQYGKIRWTYVPYTNGKPGTPITTGWDLTANAPF